MLYGSVAQGRETPCQQLANAKLGLFVHYVFGLTQAAPGRPPVPDVNTFAGALDVNGIARMAKVMGAQYVVFTSMHWRMTLLFPSQVWGALFPDHVSKRGIVGDLARALEREHIEMRTCYMIDAADWNGPVSLWLMGTV